MSRELPVKLVGAKLIVGGEWTIEYDVDIIVCLSLVCELLYNLPETVGVLIEATFVKVPKPLVSYVVVHHLLESIGEDLYVGGFGRFTLGNLYCQLIFRSFCWKIWTNLFNLDCMNNSFVLLGSWCVVFAHLRARQWGIEPLQCVL